MKIYGLSYEGRDRQEQNLLGNSSHLANDLLELAVVAYGLLEELSLLLGEGDRYGLSFLFACPAPRAGGTRGYASLGDPSEFCDTGFESLVAGR